MNNENEQAAEVIAEAADEEPKAKQPWHKRKRNIGLAAACAVVLIAGGAGTVVALNQQAPAAVENVASSSGSSSSSSDSSKAQSKETGQKSKETSNDASRPADSTTPNTSGQAEGGEASDTANSTNTSNETNTPAVAQASGSEGQKTWVADYQQQWVPNVVTVVDSEAWDEQVPVYSYDPRPICGTCGADISGNITAHQKAHALAGEGTAYHTEVVPILTGYDTVHHDAVTHTEDQGHYENVAAGGHWE